MESTLSISRDELRAEIGSFLGYGRGAAYSETAWTAIQERAIDSCLNSGLHRFYFPPPLPNERVAHEWSFLKPTAQLTLADGKSAVPLPDDFGGLSGGVLQSSPAGRSWSPLRVVGTGEVDRLAAQDDDVTGCPRVVAIRPLKGTGRDQGQRFELAVFPKADQEYVLKLAYTLAPNALTAAHPYPYGGPIHRETVLESCLAVAEKRLDDEATVHHGEFMMHLAASVSHDRKFRPQMLGYNGNGRSIPDRRHDSILVTVDDRYSSYED